MKEFSELPPDTNQVAHATALTIPEPSPQPTPGSAQPDEGLRDLLHHRYTAPFVNTIPYHRWGIND